MPILIPDIRGIDIKTQYLKSILPKTYNDLDYICLLKQDTEIPCNLYVYIIEYTMAGDIYFMTKS